MRDRDLFEKKRIRQRYHLNVVRDLRAIDDRRRANNIRYNDSFRVTMSLLTNDYEIDSVNVDANYRRKKEV